MLTLIKLTREQAIDLWDEHFKTILLLLLETLGDLDVSYSIQFGLFGLLLEKRLFSVI